jgi:hypothetical protein
VGAWHPVRGRRTLVERPARPVAGDVEGLVEGLVLPPDYYDKLDAFLFYWPDQLAAPAEAATEASPPPPVVLLKVGESGATLLDYDVIIAKCQCFESRYSETDIWNPIIAKPTRLQSYNSKFLAASHLNRHQIKVLINAIAFQLISMDI